MTAQDYLKAIREKGLTQAEVAARTDIPQGTISKIERGQVGDVLSATYLKLQKLHAELHNERSATNHPGERAGDRPNQPRAAKSL